MQKAKIVFYLFDFRKELFRQLRISLSFLNSIHNIIHFEFKLYNLFIVVDWIPSKPVDLLWLSFDLILKICKAVIEPDQFVLDFINGRSSRSP